MTNNPTSKRSSWAFMNFRRHFCFQLLGLMMLASAHPLTAAPEKMPGSDKVLLFVDDHDVLYRSGTERVLQPLQRFAGNPVIKNRENPWEIALAWMSVYRNPETGKYQLWYQAFAGNESADKTRRCTVCYAESDDGITFTKPKLRLFDFNGIKETNIVLIANGGYSDRYGVSVVVDAAEKDPARRYKMAYYDFSRAKDGHEYPGLSVAFSPDGIHWTKHPEGPLTPASYGHFGEAVPFPGETDRRWSNPLAMSDALDVLYDSPRGVFAIYGKMWIDGPDGGMYWKHAMGRIESRDFVHWSKPEMLLAPDELDPAFVEFHTTPVFLYHDYYLSPIQILNRGIGGGVIDIELATSRDGRDWQRNFRNPFWLSRRSGAEFDSGSIFVCPQGIVLEDEIRFYYGAYSQGATGADDLYLNTGIGMATIPRDRFAGFTTVAESKQPTLKKPLQHIGQVTLKPIDFTGGESLELNANAAKGAVRAELLTDDGRRILGYTADDAIPLKGDSLRHVVKWTSKESNRLPAGRYLLRLHLDNATVYALTIRNESKPN